jgi:hypothetical protein
MSDQRWQRIEEICHEALERSPERALFVRRPAPATRAAPKWNRCSPTKVAPMRSDPD